MVFNPLVKAAFAELIGTALLIFLGNGVVANSVLKKTYGENSGLIVVSFGWAMAAFIALFATIPYSGGHLNPVVTLALALHGSFSLKGVLPFVICQMLGGALGAALVFLFYHAHFRVTQSPEAKLSVFCTLPALPNVFDNLLSEVIATFILVFVILRVGPSLTIFGHLAGLPYSFLMLGLGLSLGGTTGCALNPARDLSPRMVHALLSFPFKGSSQWSYAWIPVVGPFIGSLLAVVAVKFL